MSIRSKLLTSFTSFAAAGLASASLANASGPEIGDDNFSVTFNGQASISVGYHHGNLIAEPAIVGSTWSSPGAFLTPVLSVILGGGPLVATDLIGDKSSFTNMSTQYTRFGFTAQGDSALGAFKARIEGDFVTTAGNVANTGSAGDAFRIRHAYGEVGPILAGQTQSLWSDGHFYVSGWDWNGDVVSPGNNIARKQQLRYTHSFASGAKLAVAMEAESDTASAFSGTGAITPDQKFFDLTANLQTQVGAADVTVSAIYSFEDDAYDVVPFLGAIGIDGESYAVAASARLRCLLAMWMQVSWLFTVTVVLVWGASTTQAAWTHLGASAAV
mgnify:CR=1 FL=1